MKRNLERGNQIITYPSLYWISIFVGRKNNKYSEECSTTSFVSIHVESDFLKHKHVLLKQRIATYGRVSCFQAAYRLWKYIRSTSSEMVPVGIIKDLYVYPVKSCKGISVFSFFCDKEGAVSGENRDRQFVVIDGKSGRFYNSSVKPMMVTIECEVHDGILNVSTLQFRPVMVIDECPAWDEDKWLDLQIGEVRLQCFRPCFRCLAITVDPETGVKDSNVQPLKKLREFRLAPEGKMRNCFKDSPLFGVNVGVDRPVGLLLGHRFVDASTLNLQGYVHVGQTVYARYKKSAF
ncbi:unnamed protein product [Haemonchus placei]|uniref:MOSC domain-containing protein n=1 Tax=Haemonchus placei TaxID=6290 RepID=A0A0N4WP36_HAEPC|nr:unnamed protein product [Haemonchus placei]